MTISFCQAKEKIKELEVHLDQAGDMRQVLERCAATALNSKLIGSHNDFFSKMVVDAVMHLDEDLDINLIGIKKEKGGSMEVWISLASIQKKKKKLKNNCVQQIIKDSLLVEGVAFKKCFSYAGFEQQPKKFKDPKILLLNLELELKAEKDNAELRIEDPSVMLPFSFPHLSCRINSCCRSTNPLLMPSGGSSMRSLISSSSLVPKWYSHDLLLEILPHSILPTTMSFVEVEYLRR